MTNIYEDLKQSLEEAGAHMRGEDVGVIFHEPISPRAVREKAEMTQDQMAGLMGMSLSGYRKWEQGQRSVSGPAKTLLVILDKNPKAVLDAVT